MTCLPLFLSKYHCSALNLSDLVLFVPRALLVQTKDATTVMNRLESRF